MTSKFRYTEKPVSAQAISAQAVIAQAVSAQAVSACCETLTFVGILFGVVRDWHRHSSNPYFTVSFCGRLSCPLLARRSVNLDPTLILVARCVFYVRRTFWILSQFAAEKCLKSENFGSLSR